MFRRLPLANLFNDGFTSSVRPALTYDTRDNRLFPTAGVYLRGSTELAAARLRLRQRVPPPPRRRPLLLPARLAASSPSSTCEGGHVTSPSQDGVPIFARFFLGGIFDVRGFRFRTIGPRVPLTQTPTRTLRPSPTARTSAAT